MTGRSFGNPIFNEVGDKRLQLFAEGTIRRPQPDNKFINPLFYMSLMNVRGRCWTIVWRRGGDSNPRYGINRMPVFETGAFNHSATSPIASEGIGIL